MSLELFGNESSSEATYINYVFGALVSVRTDRDGNVGGCTFITRGRLDSNGTPEQLVGAVITSDNQIIAIELLNDGSTPNTLEVQYPHDGEESFYNPKYVIVLVHENTLTLWVDGEVYVDQWELQEVLPDENQYEENVLSTVNPERGCVMTGIWGYGF
jgi:hypothetical protein